MKVLFVGSSEFSLPVLQMLYEYSTVVGVLTMPDRPAGRKLVLTPTPVKLLAQEHGSTVLQPEKLDATARSMISACNPEIMICASYGKIFGKKFLALFPRGSVNVHPSLLPRYRGAAPIPAAILAGDAVTGVTLQKIAADMDAGDIILQSTRTVARMDTTKKLSNALAQDSAQLVKQLLANFDSFYKDAYPQNADHAVYCQKILSGHGYVTWMECALHIEQMVKAFGEPYSGVKVIYKGNTLKIWDALAVEMQTISETVQSLYQSSKAGYVLAIDAEHGILVRTVQGILGLKKVQLSGRTKLAWHEFVKGGENIVGAVLQ